MSQVVPSAVRVTASSDSTARSRVAKPITARLGHRRRGLRSGIILGMGLLLCSGNSARANSEQTRTGLVLRAVQSFFAAGKAADFRNAAEWATEDYSHLNPVGGWTRTRAIMIPSATALYSTGFLKGVTITPDAMDVRFGNTRVAVVTVPTRFSTFTTPDGIIHPDNEVWMWTFVVVRQGRRWLIMQNHASIRSAGVTNPPLACPACFGVCEETGTCR